MKTKAIKYLLLFLTILLFPTAFAAGGEKRDSVVVSLITCWPGSEVYELCGHEAIRVRGIADGLPVDSIWNYGVFDFNTPNFVYRFVKGETDYMLAGYPFAWFLSDYQQHGRKVIEQDLNLTSEEALRLTKMLREEGRPENRTYRYNYVRDNCATRILDRIDSVAASPVVYPHTVNYGTFRNAMRAYHKNYPWYQFGIDLALGSGIDIPITGRMEMFVPVEMALKADGASFADGRPLVRETRVLNQGVENATLPPTPWYLTPLAVALLMLLIAILASTWMIAKKRIMRAFYCGWFAICGIAGTVIAFLVFFSEHEATSPNVLLLWLNPLQLLAALAIWSRKMRIISYAMAYYNIIIPGLLLLVWPFQAQSGNPAFFPLMGATLILAAAFAWTAPKVYDSNNYGRITFNNKDARPSSSRKGGKRSAKSTLNGKRRK